MRAEVQEHIAQLKLSIAIFPICHQTKLTFPSDKHRLRRWCVSVLDISQHILDIR